MEPDEEMARWRKIGGYIREAWCFQGRSDDNMVNSELSCVLPALEGLAMELAAMRGMQDSFLKGTRGDP